MRVVITGASGFVGKETCKILKQREIDYVKLSRSNKQGYFETDYSVEELSNILQETDVVVHLAAMRGGESKEGYSAYRSNEIITENVLKAMVRKNVNKIIYLSSISVYSDLHNLPWNEKQPVKPMNFYGLSKLVSEELCDLYKKQGISPTIFRCAHVLGFEDNNYMLSRFFRGAAEKKQLTVSGRSVAKREFIYVKDVARALLWAVENRHVKGIFNLGTGKGTTNYEIACEINRRFDNVGNLDYQSDIDEGILDSYMSIDKLAKEGFKSIYSIENAICDIKQNQFS